MPRELALFVFIDALGWEISRRNSFMEEELRFRAPLGTVFGYSSTCDPTILTGRMPAEHGHFSFFYYNPKDSPFGLTRILGLLPKSITRRGRVRRWMSRIIGRLYGITGYFQIYNMPFRHLYLFDYSEKRDIYEPGGINAGHRTIFDELRDRKILFHLSDWRRSEERNLAALEADLKAGRPEFVYLYMAAMDATLHAEGTHAPAVAEKLKWYETRLRTILEIAKAHYDGLRLYVFSDHGMTDVTATLDLIGPVEGLGLKFGVDYAAVYDSTMARFWFFTPGAEERIRGVLSRQPMGRLLNAEDLAGFGCEFPGKKYGELFFLADPGVLICPSFMGEKPLAGMHGYTPHDVDSIAFFGANTDPDPFPKRLDDLYALMLTEVKRIEGAAHE